MCSGAPAPIGRALGGSASSKSPSTRASRPAARPAHPAHPPCTATASRHASLCSGVHACMAATSASETPYVSFFLSKVQTEGPPASAEHPASAAKRAGKKTASAHIRRARGGTEISSPSGRRASRRSVFVSFVSSFSSFSSFSSPVPRRRRSRGRLSTRHAASRAASSCASDRRAPASPSKPPSAWATSLEPTSVLLAAAATTAPSTTGATSVTA
mmetsp:Transcript_844/g.3329  ORF Transcript_844/g.3329 Transcript_844/m.3329 type:complete len:215 (-) Transcript_844:477-1121(-)